MTTEQIIAEIDAEIARLKQVRALLSPSATPTNSGPKPVRKRRTLSKAARARIAAAQRKRWAEQKRTASTK